MYRDKIWMKVGTCMTSQLLDSQSPAYLSVMLARGPYCERSGANINDTNPNPSSFLFLLNCEFSVTLGGLGTCQQLHDVAKLKWCLGGASQQYSPVWGLLETTYRNIIQYFISFLTVLCTRMKGDDLSLTSYHVSYDIRNMYRNQQWMQINK